MLDSNDEGKLDSVYTFRIPSHTKSMTDKLSVEDKADLNYRLRLTIAKKLHEINFDASIYLGEGK